MDTGLKGTVVLVTGASKGIGLACAIAMAKEGARVVGVSRNRAHLEMAQGDLHGQGLDMTIVAADLSDAGAATAAIDKIEADVGPIGVLVNSAGAARRYAPDELDSAAHHQAFDAKYFTYINVIDPVIKRMAERGGGSIVNIVGQGGRQASDVHIAGGAANAALMLASVGYAKAYAAKDVRVNVINPGLTRTGRVEEGLAASMRSSGKSRDETLAAMLAEIPRGRMAEPDEVANVVVFLASDLASYVSGAIIPMDGGRASVI
jgi:NAD(P)-dependent dehydrogenase (short-subunit alcohol dehydrogenase family)